MSDSVDRFPGKLTIGICTVSTRPENYLLQTLDGLIGRIPSARRDNIQIVVLDCDATPSESAYLREVRARFQAAIESGTLIIHRTLPEDYPDLEQLPGGFGDSPDRVRWRSKQCVDYGLLFARCCERGDYYLHLEDDVVCAEDIYDQLTDELDRYVDESWSAIRFCELGFIGVLFRSQDLPKLSSFFRTFYDEMPVDWLAEHFFSLRERRGEQVITTERALFQHIGHHSSLPGKTSELQSARFKRGQVRVFLERSGLMKPIFGAVSGIGNWCRAAQAGIMRRPRRQ